MKNPKENVSLRLSPHREGAKNGFHIHMYHSLIIPAYRKHQHKEYTYKIVQSVYTATKLTTSLCCNYNSWHRSQWFI